MQVTDGNGGSDTQAIAVTVTNVNERAAHHQRGGAVSTAENQTAVTTVAATDVDGATPVYSIVGGADAALFSIDAASGVLTFITAPDFEAPADAGADNVYDVTVQVADGNGGSDTQAIAVSVTNGNELPVIVGPAAVTMVENQSAVTTVASTDVDGAAPSYSIAGGADAALFTIDAASGALRFIGTKDFEAPADADRDNVYEVSVQVADGNGGFDVRAMTVRITNVNEAPDITSLGGGATASIAVGENEAAVALVTATDPEGDAPRYRIVGGADAARFTIDADAGTLGFVAAPDFEAPADADADNVYQLVVAVDDGQGGSDLQAIAVGRGRRQRGAAPGRAARGRTWSRTRRPARWWRRSPPAIPTPATCSPSPSSTTAAGASCSTPRAAACSSRPAPCSTSRPLPATRCCCASPMRRA